MREPAEEHPAARARRTAPIPRRGRQQRAKGNLTGLRPWRCQLIENSLDLVDGV
jgi:hypothetical protein